MAFLKKAKHPMRLLVLLTGAAIAATLVPSAASAATCEETFVKKGNGVTGLRFIAMTAVADLPPDVAINQMRGIVARKGYDIIAAEPAGGAMLIEQAQTATTRAFPIEITATVANGVGTVQMEARPKAGQFIKADLAKAEMCGLLAQLKGGKEGRMAAKANANATTVQAAPVVVSAQILSQQISKDIERNPLSVSQRYTGKRFTLSGRVERISQDGKDYRVWFEIDQPHELVIRLPGGAQSHVEMGCALAAGQSVFAMKVKPKMSITLTGTYDGHDASRGVVWFKDCVPEKK